MANTTITTPYASAMPFVKTALASWLDEYSAQRLSAYDLYDDLFTNAPVTAQFMIRGSNDKPVYLPTAKYIINNLARYVGRDWGYSASVVGIDPLDEDQDVSDPATLAANQGALDAIDSLFRRCRLVSQFTASKKEFLRRGDWIWYISADAHKEQGSRIDISTVDPRRYKPVMDDPDDLSRVTGAILFEEITDPTDDSKMAVKVQQWLKPTSSQYTGDGVNITYELIVVEQDSWQDDEGNLSKDAVVIQTLAPLVTLEGITQLPVYHIKNNEETDNPFGRSDLEGLETVFGGINQTASDEDWAISSMGLGQYVAKGVGAPVDENGNDADWSLGPGRVVEIPAGVQGADTDFKKIDGINSVQPMLDHMQMLRDAAKTVNGLSDVAMGQDTSNISGVALALKLQPVFDTADEKDTAINEVWTQLLYDLRDWFQVYEGTDISALRLTSTTSKDGRMPFDRTGRFQEILDLVTAGLISVAYAQQKLNDEFGYDIPLDEITNAASGNTTANPGATDDTAVNTRISSELNA